MAQKHWPLFSEMMKDARELAAKSSLDDLAAMYKRDCIDYCPPYPPGYEPGTGAGDWYRYGDAANPWVEYGVRGMILGLAIDITKGRIK